MLHLPLALTLGALGAVDGCSTIPIVVHINRRDEPPIVVVRDAVDDMFDVANEAFEDSCVELKRVATVYDDHETIMLKFGPLDNKLQLAYDAVYSNDDGAYHVYVIDVLWDIETLIVYGGVTLDPLNDLCRSVIFVRGDTDTKILAHEVGHMLGLVHVDDVTNVMYPGMLDEAVGFDASQLSDIMSSANEMSSCWWYEDT